MYGDHTDWDIYVRAICYGYNTSICIDSTQFAPFFLMYGREPFYLLDTILPNMQEAPCQVHEHVLKLAHAREVGMTNVKESQEIIKRKYDRNATQEPLQPGELVWIFYPEINVGGSPKLFHNWSGPYLLMEKISPTNFKVVQAHDLKPLKNPIHINRMKRFHHRAITPTTPENLHSLQHGDPVPQIQELHVGDQRNVINDKTCDLKKLNRLSQEASQLEPLQVLAKDNDNRDDVELPDPPVLRTEEESRLHATEPEYEINKIIKSRYNKREKLEYLLDWKGYPASSRTYEPLENLNTTAQEYVKSHDIPITGTKTH